MTSKKDAANLATLREAIEIIGTSRGRLYRLRDQGLLRMRRSVRRINSSSRRGVPYTRTFPVMLVDLQEVEDALNATRYTKAREQADMFKAGHSEASIAATFGIQVHSVQRNLQRLGLRAPRPCKPWTPREEQQVVEWYDSGICAREIAERLQRSTLSIYSRIDDLRKQGRGPRKGGKIIRKFASRRKAVMA